MYAPFSSVFCHTYFTTQPYKGKKNVSSRKTKATDVNDFSQPRPQHTPKRFVYYSDHGTIESEVEGALCPRDGCTSFCPARNRPVQSLTLAGEGPLTKGGGARFFGLARGSSS